MLKTVLLIATFVALALGFEMMIWFVGWLANRVGGWVRYASPALLAVLLIGGAATTARDYFITWPANDEVQRVYRTDLAEKAVKSLTDAKIDVNGAAYTPAVVTLSEGGKTAVVAMPTMAATVSK